MDHTHMCCECWEEFECPNATRIMDCGHATGTCPACTATHNGTYNGWANYGTWNVALWITNTPELWEFVEYYAADYPTGTYEGLVDMYIRPVFGDVTPDGVSWTDPTLDYDSLTDATVRTTR